MRTLLIVPVVTSFVLLRLSKDFFGSAASYKDSQMPVALIHHPNAALDYFLQTEAYPEHDCLTEFEKLEDYRRREVSLDHLAGAISFSLPQDRRDYVTDECAFFLVGRLKAPRNSFAKHLSFTSEVGRHETPAQIYHSKHDQESWAIAPGFHEGVLIVFNRQNNADDFELFGLLERPPDVTPDLSQEQLETRYVTGNFDPLSVSDSTPVSEQGESSTSSTERTNLCDLSDHERFRACSVGYVAWNYSGKVTNDVSYRGAEGNYIDLRTPANRSKCLSGVVMVDLEREVKFFRASVIPCAINRDAMHANFFLTADPFSADGMFKVAPIWKRDDPAATAHSIDEETYGYKLELFMSNVRVLKSFPEPQQQTDNV